MRAIWIHLNQVQDEFDLFSYVDLYADYLITFVSHPEAFKKFLDSQNSGVSTKHLNVELDNKAAREKSEKAAKGEVIETTEDAHIAERMKEIVQRMAKRKNEEFKELGDP